MTFALRKGARYTLAGSFPVPSLMTTWRGLVECLHITALGVWFGMVGAGGAAAAVVFPTLKAANVQLPGYEAAGADTYRVAGGMIAEKVFFIADIVMFPCAAIAIATFGLLIWVFGVPARRPATFVRGVALAAALAAFASMLFIITPALNHASRLHWAALKAGDAAEAARHRAAVDDLHPMASNLMAGMALAVLIALVTAIWSLAVPWLVAGSKPASRYPEPALLRKRGRA